jgi:hypothetical protein
LELEDLVAKGFVLGSQLCERAEGFGAFGLIGETLFPFAQLSGVDPQFVGGLLDVLAGAFHEISGCAFKGVWVHPWGDIVVWHIGQIKNSTQLFESSWIQQPPCHAQ